jgi:hypothetical protein
MADHAIDHLVAEQEVVWGTQAGDVLEALAVEGDRGLVVVHDVAVSEPKSMQDRLVVGRGGAR